MDGKLAKKGLEEGGKGGKEDENQAASMNSLLDFAFSILSPVTLPGASCLSASSLAACFLWANSSMLRNLNDSLTA